MSFEGKPRRDIHGSELKRGQVVRVRVGDDDLGVCILDEPTARGGDAVWISFAGAAPRGLPADND